MLSLQRAYFEKRRIPYGAGDRYILPGIARRHLIDQCGVLGIPVDETPFTLKELMDADEVIVSSSSTLCIQAVEIDGKPVGGKDPARLGRIRSRGLSGVQ